MSKTLYPMYPILIIDDEINFLNSIQFLLKTEGFTNIICCKDGRDVTKILNNKKFSAILLDLLLPYVSGKELLHIIVTNFPDIPTSIMTGESSIDTAVECIKAGAYDYIVKPIDDNKLITCIKNMIKLNEIQIENQILKERFIPSKLEHPEIFSEIITQNNTMKSIFKYIESISKTSLPVLITGETGTGKELIARAIHNHSGRKGKFVAVNIAGIDNTILTDTLFGHKKGSFTSADSDRCGLLEEANSGTLFLDEIGDLSIDTQIKLLRLLQEKKYYSIGSDIEKVTDVRFIFATNQDLSLSIKEGKFRKDFYFRLQTHKIFLPPLRDRLDDIPLLVDYLLKKASTILNKKILTASQEIYAFLKHYNFPGNIRELEGMIFDAVTRNENGVLELNSFTEKILIKEMNNDIENYSTILNNINNNKQLPVLKEFENLLINEALKISKGNQTKASRILGISRKALNNRLIRNKKINILE